MPFLTNLFGWEGSPTKIDHRKTSGALIGDSPSLWLQGYSWKYQTCPMQGDAEKNNQPLWENTQTNVKPREIQTNSEELLVWSSLGCFLVGQFVSSIP